jgi:hypothetical protein
MVGSMDSPTGMDMDIPIKVRTKEKLTVYVVWEVTVDTDTKLVQVSGVIKHVPEDTDNDTVSKGLMGRMREMQLMLVGYVQPKDYVLDAIVVPKNSIVIIDGEKHTKCGVVSENHAIISDNYVVENVAEIDCPLTKELMETAIHLKALNYRLNSFTYKYDLMVITLLKKHGLIELP